MIELSRFEQHKFKAPLAFYGIRQQRLAATLGCSQAKLSNMLNGVTPMREAIEDSIEELLTELRSKGKKTKKFHKIIKKKKE